MAAAVVSGVGIVKTPRGAGTSSPVACRTGRGRKRRAVGHAVALLEAWGKPMRKTHWGNPLENG